MLRTSPRALLSGGRHGGSPGHVPHPRMVHGRTALQDSTRSEVEGFPVYQGNRLQAARLSGLPREDRSRRPDKGSVATSGRQSGKGSSSRSRPYPIPPWMRPTQACTRRHFSYGRPTGISRSGRSCIRGSWTCANIISRARLERRACSRSLLCRWCRRATSAGTSTSTTS